jgi:enoyl-[acyl-carrier protein] reductase II
MSILSKILECKHPIIQGPIGALNDPKYVAAISEAGAFGMLALGFSTPEDAGRLAREVRDLTDKPFGANLMIMNPANEEILEALASFGVKTVTTSAGSPKNIYPKIHELGMYGLHVLLSLPHALKAEAAGVDGLVITGNESGGLRSLNPESSTMVLVPMVVEQVKIPVVAAGGIADSRGYRAAFSLGAVGVQIGTRFIATEESPAPQAWKDAIVNCKDGGTTLLSIGNMNMRVIVDDKLRGIIADPKEVAIEHYNFSNAPSAWQSGDFDLFPAGAGEVAALIKDIKPVKEIIEEMVS